MPPRIRSFLSRPPYKREARASARKAPTVFREFVETLQRLDPPPANGTTERRRYGRGQGRAAEGASAATSKRKQLGNGHARPRGRGRTQ